MCFSIQYAIALFILPTSVFCLQLEFNWRQYNELTVIVSRNHVKGGLFTVPKKWAINQVNSIIQQNQKLGITWIIQDSQLSNYHFTKYLLTTSYTSEKVVHRLPTNRTSGSFTLILTDVSQLLFFEQPRYTNEGFQNVWGRWISYTTGLGGLSILPDRILIAAIAHFDPISLAYLKYHEGIYLSPFITLVFQIENQETISRVWWACHYCSLEKSLYTEFSPFIGKMNHTLLTAFLLQNQARPSIYEKSIYNLVLRPILSVSLTQSETTFKPRFECKGKVSSYVKRFHTNAVGYKGECSHTHILVLKELAEAVNFSIAFGSVLTNNWKRVYAQAQILFYERNQAWIGLNLKTRSLLHYDELKLDVSYCEQSQNYTLPNMLVIIGEPFDLGIWAALGATIVCLYFYFREEKILAKRKSLSRLSTAFEIFKMLIQKSVDRIEPIRVICLFAFSLTEFFYMSVLTEKIIIPVENTVVGTLSQLFTQGYKVRQLETSRIAFASYVASDLLKEGFKGDVISAATEDPELYWWPQLQPVDFNFNYTRIKAAEEHFIDKYKFIMTAPFSKLVPWTRTVFYYETPNGILKTCYHLKKHYGLKLQTGALHSKAKHKLMPKLSRIVYDSGIRQFWAMMYTRFHERWRLYREKMEEKVSPVKLSDNRFVAMIQLLVLGLSASILVFAHETNMISKILHGKRAFCTHILYLAIIYKMKGCKHVKKIKVRSEKRF